MKSKQLHNNIKSEQKGNKMLFVFFIFVILWLNEIKRFKHEKHKIYITIKKNTKNIEKSFGGGMGGGQAILHRFSLFVGCVGT